MLDVPANDHGALYILEYSGPPLTGDKAAMIRQIIGAVTLDLDYVDVISTGARNSIALPDLIRQGYDLPLTTDQANSLRIASGLVVVLMSRAFGGKAVRIRLPDDTRTVMVLRDKPATAAPDKLTSTGAAGNMNGPQTAKKPKSEARMSGMVATIALLLMFALVGLMVWVGQ